MGEFYIQAMFGKNILLEYMALNERWGELFKRDFRKL